MSREREQDIDLSPLMYDPTANDSDELWWKMDEGQPYQKVRDIGLPSVERYINRAEKFGIDDRSIGYDGDPSTVLQSAHMPTRFVPRNYPPLFQAVVPTNLDQNMARLMMDLEFLGAIPIGNNGLSAELYGDGQMVFAMPTGRFNNSVYQNPDGSMDVKVLRELQKLMVIQQRFQTVQEVAGRLMDFEFLPAVIESLGIKDQLKELGNAQLRALMTPNPLSRAPNNAGYRSNSSFRNQYYGGEPNYDIVTDSDGTLVVRDNTYEEESVRESEMKGSGAHGLSAAAAATGSIFAGFRIKSNRGRLNIVASGWGNSAVVGGFTSFDVDPPSTKHRHERSKRIGR